MPADIKFITKQKNKAAKNTYPLSMFIDKPASPNDVTNNQSRNSQRATYEKQSPKTPPKSVSTRFSVNT